MDWRDHRKEEAAARDRIWQTLLGVNRLRVGVSVQFGFLCLIWLMVAGGCGLTIYAFSSLRETVVDLQSQVVSLRDESQRLRTECEVSNQAMLLALDGYEEKLVAARAAAERVAESAESANARIKELETVLDLRNTVSMDFLRTIDKQSADALAAVEKLDPHKTGIQIAQLQLAVGGVSDAMREIALDVEELTERPVTTCECPMVSACPCEPEDVPPPPVVPPSELLHGPAVNLSKTSNSCRPRFFPRLRRFWK